MLLFHQRLRGWRAHRGLSQEIVSRRAGIPRPNLAALESGRRECTLTTLYRLATALEVSPGQLLDSEPASKRPSIDRHEIDHLARCLIAGRAPRGRRLMQIYQGARSAGLPLLRVAGIRPATKVGRKGRRFQDREVVSQVLQRVRRLLPSLLVEVHR